METLKPDESWELLLKTAFFGKSKNVKCSPELERIGRKILDKCEGLPLAITVAGGLLREQGEPKSRWEQVLQEMNSHHLEGSKMDDIPAVLELSYHHLSPELKACFLSLGFFKEDVDIRAKRLVHIWVAQGFVPQEGHEMMEEIARGYLDELISRNLVQVKEMGGDDRVRTCHVHDLIRQLSIAKAKEEICFEILREVGNPQSSHGSRHRAMYCSNGSFIYSTNQNRHLRSLFVHGANQLDVSDGLSSHWKSYELLRILDFEGSQLTILPDGIGSLIELRYLGLRGTKIEELPLSLGKLKKLQVLDLRYTDVEIPNFIWKMVSLRHLYMRYIWCREPLNMSTLKFIQTLSYIYLRDTDLEEIAGMTSLRKLGVDMGDKSVASALITSLAKLENLAHLSLRYHNSLNMDGFYALQHITQLKLKGPMTKLPDVSSFPPNLSYLSFNGTQFDEDPMPVLEKLPYLLYLKLSNAYVGDEMVISHDGFPRLKVLRIVHLLQLRNIQIGKGGGCQSSNNWKSVNAEIWKASQKR